MKPKNLLLLFLFLFLFSFSARAENEAPPTPDSMPEQAEPPTEESTSTEEAELCICGRPIYSESGQGYSKFDCTKCRQNYLLCRCVCWCGAETYTETEGEGQPLFCNGCKKRCTECTCADKEILLKREKQIAEGSLSPLGLQKPTSFAAISVVLLFLLAALYFALTAQARKALPSPPKPIQNEKAKKSSSEPPLSQPEGRTAPIPIDISEIPALDAYEAAEEWISRNIRKRPDLLAELGAFWLSAGQFAELKERAGLTPNEKCPVNTDAPRKPLPQTLATRESLTQEGLSAAKTILTPKKICTAAKRGEPGYKICFSQNSARILSDEGRFSNALTTKQISAFLRKGLCDFSDHEEKLKKPISERFRKETFTVFMALYLTGKTRFGKTAEERLAQQTKLPRELLEKAMKKLEKKGLLEENGGEYRFSFKATTLLPEPGDDTVMFRTEKQRVLFVNKTDCILCIHEQNDGYFILSCEKIPWHLYLGE